jgi:hypothetical protein
MPWHSMTTAAVIVLTFSRQSPVRTLGALEAEYPEPFSQVEGVRELRDGRVIVVDSRERLIHAVDMKAGTATRIGREGNGPGEYRIPLRVFALPGDSSAVYDMGNAARPLVITPQGTAGGSLPPVGGAPMFTNRGATDSQGRVYAEVRPVRSITGGVPLASDSSAIERLDRATGSRDTIARTSTRMFSPLLSNNSRGLSVKGIVGPGGAVPSAGGSSPPFASHDQWAVAPDGRVAIVSVDPYRVTFITPNGTRTVSPVLDESRVPVTDALKELWREEARRPVSMLVSSRDGQMTAQSRPPQYNEPAAWPDVLPPFLSRALSFAPDGMLWVKRAVAADSAPGIDVIDRAGKIAYRIALPKQSKLVGFGPASVYLVRIDFDDLQYLQRYPLPSKP